MRLFLVRHGAVIPPQPMAFYGDADVSLSELGQAEARAAAAFLAPVNVDQVVSSPLTRARYGAEQVAAQRGLAIDVREDLREIKRGRWFGLTRAEVRTRWPGDLEAHHADPEHWNGHGGESLGEFRDRVLKVRDALLDVYSGRTVVLVSHNFTSCAILADASGLTLADWPTIRIPTASVSLLDYAATDTVVRWIGHKPDRRTITEVFPRDL